MSFAFYCRPLYAGELRFTYLFCFHHFSSPFVSKIMGLFFALGFIFRAMVWPGVRKIFIKYSSGNPISFISSVDLIIGALNSICSSPPAPKFSINLSFFHNFPYTVLTGSAKPSTQKGISLLCQKKKLLQSLLNYRSTTLSKNQWIAVKFQIVKSSY